jgi:hypothetical protein
MPGQRVPYTAETSFFQTFLTAIDGIAQPRLRRHELTIVSYCIDFTALRSMINAVAERVRLAQVEVLFEIMDVHRGRDPRDAQGALRKLEAWCARRAIGFTAVPLRGGEIMHAKGYALVQLADGEINLGVLAIGSANATRQGLGTEPTAGMNIEMSVLMRSGRDLSVFLGHCGVLRQEYSCSLDEAIARAERFAFRYALLASGVFLHDWRDSLRSRVSIRYRLTEAGRAHVMVTPQLASLGFSPEQDTVSRNPLADSVDFPDQRLLPSRFRQDYAPETFLGFWCPRQIWQAVLDLVGQDTAMAQFHRQFLAATEDVRLESLVRAEAELIAPLVKDGLIVEDDERLDRWRQRIQDLRESKDRLDRIFLRYQEFELPYEFSSRKEVNELWDSLFGKILTKRRHGPVERKLLEAEEEKSLSPLKFDRSELADLRAMLADALAL